VAIEQTYRRRPHPLSRISAALRKSAEIVPLSTPQRAFYQSAVTPRLTSQKRNAIYNPQWRPPRPPTHGPKRLYRQSGNVNRVNRLCACFQFKIFTSRDRKMQSLQLLRFSFNNPCAIPAPLPAIDLFPRRLFPG
jgi:hypothetical protein